jgi:hypothetical protein
MGTTTTVSVDPGRRPLVTLLAAAPSQLALVFSLRSVLLHKRNKRTEMVLKLY